MKRSIFARVGQEVRALVARLFGVVPEEWFIERFDLDGLAFFGGPSRAFFEPLSAEQCFSWLFETLEKYPEGVGGINPQAVRGRCTPVYKETGKGEQLFLIWMWQRTHQPR